MLCDINTRASYVNKQLIQAYQISNNIFMVIPHFFVFFVTNYVSCNRITSKYRTVVVNHKLIEFQYKILQKYLHLKVMLDLAVLTEIFLSYVSNVM